MPPTRDNILTLFYNSPELKRLLSATFSNRRDWREDAKQYIFEALCKLPEDRLQDMAQRDGLRFYAAGLIRIMLQDDRSEFNRQQRFSGVELQEGTPAEDSDYQERERVFQMLAKGMEQLAPVKRQVIELCAANGGNAVKVAGIMQLSERTVRYFREQATTELKQTIGGMRAPC